MQDQTTAPAGVEQEPALASVGRAQWRVQCRELALQSALQKRTAGVPTYTVAEAAALLSVSQEHLYRLVRAGAFPAVALRMGRHGRYVVPAQAVESLLSAAAQSGGCVDSEEWAQTWSADRAGGAR